MLLPQGTVAQTQKYQEEEKSNTTITIKAHELLGDASAR